MNLTEQNLKDAVARILSTDQILEISDLTGPVYCVRHMITFGV